MKTAAQLDAEIAEALAERRLAREQRASMPQPSMGPPPLLKREVLLPQPPRQLHDPCDRAPTTRAIAITAICIVISVLMNYLVRFS